MNGSIRAKLILSVGTQKESRPLSPVEVAEAILKILQGKHEGLFVFALGGLAGSVDIQRGVTGGLQAIGVVAEFGTEAADFDEFFCGLRILASGLIGEGKSVKDTREDG